MLQSKRIRGSVKQQMEKSQREYYLNEQMKAIQKSSGHGGIPDEIADLEQKLPMRACPRRRATRPPPS